MEGRSEEKKAELIRELTDTVVAVLGSKPEQVRVQLIEVPTTNWGIGGKTAKQLGR
jgi:4-oxalocrotonate tautomerase